MQYSLFLCGSGVGNRGSKGSHLLGGESLNQGDSLDWGGNDQGVLGSQLSELDGGGGA